MNAAVKALIIDNNKNILILFRSATHPHWAHHQDLPGRTLEDNEDFIDTLVREIEEETSLILAKESFRHAFTKSHKDGKYVLYVSEIEKIPTSKINLSWEHSHFELISLQNLKNLTLPENADKYFISVQDYLKKNTNLFTSFFILFNRRLRRFLLSKLLAWASSFAHLFFTYKHAQNKSFFMIWTVFI